MVLLTGCGALNTAIKKRDLEVKTTMSDTIWLDPVKKSDKTIYIQTKNTTSENIDLDTLLSKKLSSKGYILVDDPVTANYWLMINVLKLDKMDLREAEGLLSNGYGSALMGAAALGGIASYNTSSSGAVLGAGLIGSVIGFAADAFVEDINYALITDIQIVEKSNIEQINEITTNIKQGNSGVSTIKSIESNNLKRFQTRIASNANQMNLEFESAKPKLIAGLVQSISGIF